MKQALRRVLPAGQSLESANCTSVKVDSRLEVESQHISFDGIAQLQAKSVAALRFLMKVRIVDGDMSAPGALYLVQGKIGLL